MTIREYVAKHFDDYGINYPALMRLIKKGKLVRGVHYKVSPRITRGRYTVNEAALNAFFEGQ